MAFLNISFWLEFSIKYSFVTHDTHWGGRLDSTVEEIASHRACRLNNDSRSAMLYYLCFA